MAGADLADILFKSREAANSLAHDMTLFQGVPLTWPLIARAAQEHIIRDSPSSSILFHSIYLIRFLTGWLSWELGVTSWISE